MHTHYYTHKHVKLYMYMHIHMQTNLYIYTHEHIVCEHRNSCIHNPHIHTNTCKHSNIHKHMETIYIYTYMCMHTHTPHINRHTHIPHTPHPYTHHFSFYYSICVYLRKCTQYTEFWPSVPHASHNWIFLYYL